MMIQPGDKLLSITDTCKKLGIGKTMLYILITERKKLAVVKIGNRTLVAESEADRFIASLKSAT
jgi:predicted DNA-binding transcriptional regulator AlpA